MVCKRCCCCDRLIEVFPCPEIHGTPFHFVYPGPCPLVQVYSFPITQSTLKQDEYTQYGAKTEVIWPSLESELHLLFCHNLILVLEPLCLIESIAAGTPAQFCGSRQHKFTWKTAHIQVFRSAGCFSESDERRWSPARSGRTPQKQPTKKKMAR